MIAITIIIEVQNDLLTARTKRAVNKIQKRALWFALKWWHRNFAKRHFTRQGHGLYREVYGRSKKKRGRPLYVSGHLETVILGQPGRVTGTASRATLRLRLGLPAQYTGQRLRLKVLSRIAAQLSRGIIEDYRTAEGNVLKRGGYRKELRDYFEKMLTAVHPSEVKELVRIIKHFMKQIFKALPNKSKKDKLVIRG